MPKSHQHINPIS